MYIRNFYVEMSEDDRIEREIGGNLGGDKGGRWGIGLSEGKRMEKGGT